MLHWLANIMLKYVDKLLTLTTNEVFRKLISRSTTFLRNNSRGFETLSTETGRTSVSADSLPDTTVDSKKFLAELPNIVSVITGSDRFKTLTESRMWVDKLISYNSTGGKKTRGLLTVAAYQMLEKPEKLTEESMRQARVLGWCLELLQTALLLQDDITDNSLTRRGQTCWYRLPGVGMQALNDSTFLIATVFEILRVNFSGKPYYVGLVEIFNEVIQQISIGQHLDFMSVKNYNLFTEKNLKNLANYNFKHYTYKVPIYASLLLANRSIEDVFWNMEDTLDLIVFLNLMQNDFMDCYGDDVSGKEGTDIQEGKCRWLAVKALQQCSRSQRAEFMQNYGRPEEESVQRIKQLYDELQLPAQYQYTEQRTYEDIVLRLKSLPYDNEIPSPLILKVFHMMFQLWHKQPRDYVELK